MAPKFLLTFAKDATGLYDGPGTFNFGPVGREDTPGDVPMDDIPEKSNCFLLFLAAGVEDLVTGLEQLLDRIRDDEGTED